MNPSQKLNWSCISGCGACCRLAPEERIEAIEVLDDAQTMLYLNMVGTDGWCIHFDQVNRLCKIYSERPEFCRVKNLHEIFHFNPSETDQFAINCCKEHIQTTFGRCSEEYLRFENTTKNSIVLQ